jgi:phosphoglycerate dehydrogenase-like enzyme
MPQLLVDATIDPELVESLGKSTGLTVASVPGDHETQRELPESLIAEAQAMLCTFLPSNHEVMRSLKLVQLCSAGFAQFENLGLSTRGVRVCNASGVNDIPIAEWAITMMVALARDLPLMFRNQQQGIWDRDARFQTEIRGRTLGIWGYGGIGRETARLASAMGLRVHVLTRSGTIANTPRFRVQGTGDDAGTIPQKVFSLDQIDAFCRDLDFLLLAIPQTPQNSKIVNRSVFRSPAEASVLPQSRPRRTRVRRGPALGAQHEPHCRRGARHALQIPDAAGPSAMAHAERHHDAAHLRLEQEPALHVAAVATVRRERAPLAGRSTVAERADTRAARSEASLIDR